MSKHQTSTNKNTTPATAENPKKKMAPKQVAAIFGIVLLVAIYLITLIVAFVHPVASGKLFALCLFATLAVPLLIWIYVWMYGVLTGKRTFADFDAGIEVNNVNNIDQD